LLKLNGISATIHIEENTYEIVSEITAPPFGFLLYFNPSPNLQYHGADITSFADVEYSFQEGAVPKDVLNYDFEATQSPQTVYLKYNKKDKNLYFTENGAEAGGKSGGGFFKFFK